MTASEPIEHVEAVRATAPVRVADVGGWTDTWFGSPGRVCHLAVGPGVTVDARWTDEVEPGSVRLITPDVDGDVSLLRHAVDAVLERTSVLDGSRSRTAGTDQGIEATVRSAVPPGASLGTSASVLVALQAALDALVGGGRTPEELARLAHDTETGRAGREAGLQDQWAAAFGGAQLLSINPYPSMTRTPVSLAAAVLAALAERLVTVALGAHDSSAVHQRVIIDLVACDTIEHHRGRQALRRMSELAGEAARKLELGDLDGWGHVLTSATDAQRDLHDDLIGPAHRQAIKVARDHRVAGWKVNGAGGDGGSLSVLAADASQADELRVAYGEHDGWQVLDLTPSLDGVRVVSETR